MPIISKTAKMRWNPRNKKYFVEKGYQYTKMYDYFDVKIEDLKPTCNVKVQIKCDICGKIDTQMFSCCCNQMTVCHNSKCEFEKKKQTLKNNYGVNNIFQLESTKQKIKETCLEKYNKENYAQTDDFKEKHEKTCWKKYGAKHQLCKGTTAFKKAKQTNLERYGDKHPMKNLKIREKVVRTMRSNPSKIAASKDQIKLYNLLGGKLNYKVKINNRRFYLDIAFLKEKFYIEVDAPGHFVYAKIKGYNENECFLMDKQRDDLVHQLGYKGIRLISRKKSLIDLFKTNFDEFFISLIDKLKELLQKHERVLCDFDNKTITLEPEMIQLELNNLT